MKDKNALYDKLLLEMRRGNLTLAVLSQLQTERYGYALKRSLSESGLNIKEGTLYPLLRRLEKDGLLESSWQVVDDARPRRYYKISTAGKIMFANLVREWQEMIDVMHYLMKMTNGDNNGYK